MARFHVLWNGEISMNSSFGIAACEQIMAFQDLGVDVHVFPNQVKRKSEPIPNRVACAIQDGRNLQRFLHGNSVFIHQGFPHYFHNCDVPARVRAGIGVNDSDEVMNADVINRSCDIVFGGSQWTVDAYKKAGVTVPAKLMSYGVNPHIWKPMDRQDRDVFTFLSVSDYTGRKRINEMLEAFEAEFSDDEPVRIVYKAWGSNVDEVKKRFAHRKNIEIVWSESTIDELKKYYLEADCYVLPTSGDSIGMPFLEALATGLPCITTGKGGQTQWCNEENSWLLDCVEYKSPYLAGNQYMPDFQQLRRIMRDVSGNVGLCRIKGSLGSQMMHEKYKWIDGVRAAKEIIDELL